MELIYNLAFGSVAGLCGSVSVMFVYRKASPLTAVFVCATCSIVGFVLGWFPLLWHG